MNQEKHRVRPEGPKWIAGVEPTKGQWLRYRDSAFGWDEREKRKRGRESMRRHFSTKQVKERVRTFHPKKGRGDSIFKCANSKRKFVAHLLKATSGVREFVSKRARTLLLTTKFILGKREERLKERIWRKMRKGGVQEVKQLEDILDAQSYLFAYDDIGFSFPTATTSSCVKPKFEDLSFTSAVPAYGVETFDRASVNQESYEDASFVRYGTYRYDRKRDDPATAYEKETLSLLNEAITAPLSTFEGPPPPPPMKSRIVESEVIPNLAAAMETSVFSSAKRKTKRAYAKF